MSRLLDDQVAEMLSVQDGDQKSHVDKWCHGESQDDVDSVWHGYLLHIPLDVRVCACMASYLF
jgi:hypothetical protein